MNRADLIRQERDLRVDASRGLALWFILIDHIPGNVLSLLTLRNVAFCDATEAFVLLAGYAAGLAYGRVMDRRGWAFAAARIVGRVGTLYVSHVFLFVLFTAQVGYSAARLNAAYIDEMNLDPFTQEPYRALLEALLLRYQPSFLNILPLYVVLLGLLALALPLLRRPWLLLGLSGTFYALARLAGLAPPSWTAGGWYFNPLAWQLLFMLGACLGYRPPPPAPQRGLPWRPWIGAGCAALLLLGAVCVVLIFFSPDLLEVLPDGVNAVLWSVDKGSLHPFRLLSILALAYLLAHLVSPEARWLRGRVAAPLVLMGQQGLPVFCAGIFLSFAGRLALEWRDNWPMQVLVNVAGLGLLVAVAVVVAWYGVTSRPPRPLPSVAAADTGA